MNKIFKISILLIPLLLSTPVYSADGQFQVLHTNINITSTQIKDLFNTPITIITNPCATCWIRLVSISTRLNYVAPAYTGSSILSLTENSYTVATIVNTVYGASATTYAQTAIAATVATNNPIGANLIIRSASPAPATGNGSLDLFIEYQLIDWTNTPPPAYNWPDIGPTASSTLESDSSNNLYWIETTNNTMIDGYNAFGLAIIIMLLSLLIVYTMFFNQKS